MRRVLFTVTLLLLIFPLVVLAQKAAAQPITITPSSPQSLSVGQTQQFVTNATGNPAPQWSSSNPAVASVSNQGLVTARSAGSTTIQVKQKSQRASVSVSVTGPPPPPPENCTNGVDDDGDGLVDAADPDCPSVPPPSTVGPQATIHCPAGAIQITPGMDVAAVVNSTPAGASFCVQPGTYFPPTPLYMETGDTLTGEYGAVIDGTNVVQNWDLGGITVISGHNCGPDPCSNVTVRNLVVQNAPTYACIGIFGRTQWMQPAPTPNSDGWVVDHNRTTNCGWGISLGASSFHQATANLADHNGCGIAGYLLRDTVFDGNETSFSSNHECKFGDAERVTIRNHYAHDFGADVAMIWFDGGHQEVIENVTLNCGTGWPCVDIEINVGTVFRNSTVNVNPSGTAGGFWITNSADFLATGNTINGPMGAGSAIFWDGEDRSGSPWPAFPTNNRFVGNTFNIGSVPVDKPIGFQCSVECSRLWTTFGNYFDQNTYNVPSLAGNYFYFNGSFVPWSQWLAGGQDPNGTIIQK